MGGMLSWASGPSRKTTRYKFLRRFLMLLCNMSILSISLQLGRATALSGCILLAFSVAAQSQNAALLKVQQTADLVSPQCRMPGDLLYNLAPLQHVRSAVEQKHRLRVLAFDRHPLARSAWEGGWLPWSFGRPARIVHPSAMYPGTTYLIAGNSLRRRSCAERIVSFLARLLSVSASGAMCSMV